MGGTFQFPKFRSQWHYALRLANSAWASFSLAGSLRKSPAVRLRTLATFKALDNAVSVMAVSVICLEWEGTGVSLTA